MGGCFFWNISRAEGGLLDYFASLNYQKSSGESMNKLSILQSKNIRPVLRALSMMTGIHKPIENSIKSKLEKALSPSFLEVFNESYMHNVPEGSETHFRVVVVSEKFNDQPLINRHRMVNELLEKELQNGVHALSIVAKTPAQWDASSQTVSPSPACRGGFGK